MTKSITIIILGIGNTGLVLLNIWLGFIVHRANVTSQTILQEYTDLQSRYATLQQSINQTQVPENPLAHIAGVYSRKSADGGYLNILDLRSDGTSVMQHGESPYGAIGHAWTLAANKTSIQLDTGFRYTIDNYDLIDSKGVRWVKIR